MRRPLTSYGPPRTLELTAPALCALALLVASNACPAQVSSTHVATDHDRAPPPAEQTWPTSLLLVGTAGQPAKVPMGLDAKAALKLANTFYPHNERLALRLLRNVRTELGEHEKLVEPFYLGKYPITNEQYQRFVKATGARFPFHWWKDGAREDYLSHREKWIAAFPKLRADDRVNAPLYYWEQSWNTAKLKYEVPKGQEKFPVTFVSWRDALRFAAWAGMRLPTEPEWTLAANGGERKEFVFGNEWDEKVLGELKMSDLRDIKLKPVGAMGPRARGPFGHEDMVGQVWEWVIPLGYAPQAEKKLFEKQDQALRRDKKLGKRLPDAQFRPESAIAKGGSFFTFSNKDFVQARINCRAPLAVEQTMEGLGFRVAKTKRAAYDTSMSVLKLNFPSWLSSNKETVLGEQAGIERYELESGGEIIANYHAISVVPISYASDHKNPTAPLLQSSSQHKPLELAVLITTEELAAPEAKPGVYGLFLRCAGVPEDLRRAVQEGHRELAAEAAAKARAEKERAKEEKLSETQKKRLEEKRKAAEEKRKAAEEKKKQSAASKKPTKKGTDLTWEQVVRHYGYTREEVRDTRPDELLRHVYLHHTGLSKEQEKTIGARFKVSTEKNLLLLRTITGQWISATPTKEALASIGASQPPTSVELKGSNVRLSFPVPKNPREASRRERRGRQCLSIKLELKLRNNW